MSESLMNLKAGSRASRLALVQVEEIRSLIDARGLEVCFEHKAYQTQGDQDKTTPLTENLADDFFTNSLDQALINHEIDIAIHSAKDMPERMAKELAIFALTKSEDETDCFVGVKHFKDLPDGARVGTSSLVRQQSILKLNPKLKTVDIRGTIEERIAQLDEGKFDGIIVATIALKRLGLEDRIKDIMDWNAAPLQGQVAIVGRKADVKLKKLFAAIDVRRTYGTIHLVGAGPGDPELITLKGLNAIKQAECIVYDFLVDASLLEYAPKAEKIYAGKRKGAHCLSQDELCKLLIDKAKSGVSVVRLKGGDPFIFGRGSEEIANARSHSIDVSVTPGVSSATGIPTLLGIPLTARDVASSVAFISGHQKNENALDHCAIDIPNVDTIVFLMGLTKIHLIVEGLKRAGWKEETPMIVISKGTRVDQRVVCSNLKTIIDDIKKAALEQPALIIAGNVVDFYQAGQTQKDNVLFTGTNPQRYHLFGQVIHWPMINIQKLNLEDARIHEIKSQCRDFDCLLFTSAFSARFFFETFKTIDEWKTKKIFSIGQNTTEALNALGVEPDLTSTFETSEGFLKEIMKALDVSGKKILFPRSNLPNPYLKEKLTKQGAEVVELTVYENTKPPKKDLPTEPIDKVIFTSPSTVRNFLKDYGAIPQSWHIVAKGPLTDRYLKEAGYKSEVLISE